MWILLTYCIKEWQDSLRTWIWIIVSIVIMLLTYLARYASEITLALSRSPEYLQTISINHTARNISRGSLLFTYYTKEIGRSLIAAITFLFSTQGLVTSGSIVLTTATIVGIWAIATKAALSRGDRISIGVGFAVGLLAFIIIWAVILDNGWYNIKKIVFSLACLATCVGVSIWAILRYAPLSYSEKISISVGIGVGLPCLLLLWAIIIEDVDEWTIVYGSHTILLSVLAPVLWAIITKTQLDQSTRVSLSVGLGIGLPCLLAIIILLFLGI